jgi:CarD family transcriptional regulator
MIPVENCSEIGVRPVVGQETAIQVMQSIAVVDVPAVQNWNRRYRENMDRLKSGDLFEVVKVVKGLIMRDRQHGLSNGERKMLHSAKEILISEIVLATAGNYEEIEAHINTALA